MLNIQRQKESDALIKSTSSKQMQHCNIATSFKMALKLFCSKPSWYCGFIYFIKL